jgi:glycosyltransferase involved in cell wall biosynthesis
MVPSLVDETFSMVTLEAMLNRIPVIVSPRGNLPFLVDDKCGFVVPEHNYEEWAQKVNFLLEEDRYRTFVTEDAIIAIKEKYHPDVQSAKFLEMVRERFSSSE